MAQAIWNNRVIADSDEAILVEGNHYFPPHAVKLELFADSSTHTVCSWKGDCRYYDVVVDGQTNHDAAWYYPEPKEAAKKIAGYIAFWRGVQVK